MAGGGEKTGCDDGGGASPGFRNPRANRAVAQTADDSVRMFTLYILYTLQIMYSSLWLMGGCY